jgi:hypothetical protein
MRNGKGLSVWRWALLLGTQEWSWKREMQKDQTIPHAME